MILGRCHKDADEEQKLQKEGGLRQENRSDLSDCLETDLKLAA